MSNINFSNTNPLPGDALPVLYAKLLQALGGQPALGDSEQDSIRKIAALNGDPRLGDGKVRLLAEWLAAERQSDVHPEMVTALLAKTLATKYPSAPQLNPGAGEYDLVKVLLMQASAGPVGPAWVTVAEGGVFTNVSGSARLFFNEALTPGALHRWTKGNAFSLSHFEGMATTNVSADGAEFTPVEALLRINGFFADIGNAWTGKVERFIP
jgi:hypothetical protein